MIELLNGLNPLYSLSGLGVGILVGLTGVGGGSLMTPLLILAFGFHPATAVGTDLLYAAVTKSGGTVVHGMNRNVDWRLAGWLALGSVPATGATLALLFHLGVTGKQAGGLMSAGLGVALLLTALAIFYRGRLLRWAESRPRRLSRDATIRTTIWLGAIMGLLVSVSSVGAGAIGVTALLLLYPGLPTARIVGTDIAHAVPLTLVAGIGHWMLGSVDWLLLVSLLVGSLPGIAIGSALAVRVPEAVLRPLLATVLVVIGGKLLLSA
ncbi:sulfite exporter TauE/SafE family protein [Magnetospirillum moscoviense]|uniref:sulfite exporter TauE/SafE family protein n=1 Tax=Magnetospirillum moscoviense TaxID=1437059 RepID=UPI000A5942AB